MKMKLTFIGVAAGAHFLLWWFVIELFQASRFGQAISYPLISLSDTPWPPLDWFTFILRVALNSIIWGVCFGLLIYAVSQRFRRPVA